MKRKEFIKKSALLVGGAFLSQKNVEQFGHLPNTNIQPSDKLWQLSGTELANLIQKKQIAISEVLRAHLKRIRQINPAVNAVSTILEKDALDLAKQLEKELKSGQTLGPLFGVPFSVKDNVDLKGFATTDGVTAFINNIAEEDAPQVMALKTAGAIPLAKTNMPDFALRYHSKSQTLGHTLNPWNKALTCGGSSGGDAVAVATGFHIAKIIEKNVA